MRDILFRGKRVDNGEWVEGDLFHYESGETAIHSGFSRYGYEATEIIGRYKVLPETVGQYTGLTDKNGRKIFEGDIVRCYYSDISPFTDEIEPYEKEFLIDDIRRSEVIGWIDCADELEIIGNIYDNPKLLKGGVENG